jgi:hypothetical protein
VSLPFDTPEPVVTLQNLADQYGISLATIKRYRRDGVNVSDPEAVEKHRRNQRERTFVSSLSPKKPRSQGVVAVPVNLEPAALTGSRLERAIQLEEMAGEAYAQSRDARDCHAWTLASNARLRIEEDIRQNATEIAESDRVLADATISVLSALVDHLEACPKQFAAIVGGSGEEVASLENHFKSHMDNCFRHAILGVHMNVRGTALESLFPMVGEWQAELAAEDEKRVDFLKLPINKRRPQT